jgi:type II secretory pathway pseudopilin PulG
MSSHLILLLQARHARRTTGFTVLELMIVVGVFSVLLAIMLPVFRNVREASSRVRAKVEATALAQAVIQYKNIYGYWPGMVTETGGQLQITPTPNKPAGYINWPLVSHFSNTWFKVHVAVAGNVTAQEASYIDDNTLYRSLLPFDTRHPGTEKNLNPLNPQRIRFIEMEDEQAPTRVSLSDPWGNQYIVVMGLNPATTFTSDFMNQSTLIQRLSVSNLTAFALSYGADRKSLIFSAGVPQ